MPTTEANLYARLAGNAPLAALVGTRISRRVRPQIEATTLPAVTFDLMDGDYLMHHSGRNSACWRTYLVDVWAATPQSAEDVRQKIVEALDTAPADSLGQCIVKLLGNDYEDETKLYREALQVQMWSTAA